MAPSAYLIKIYDQLTDAEIGQHEGTEGDGQTVGDLVESVGYEICSTKGGPILSHSLELREDVGSPVYKYIEPEPEPDPEPEAETITGFYLDGNEYKFEGGGGTADGISTTQPSNPVAGSTYYDTTNKVVKVYNGTSWEEVGGGNVIAMTQAAYDALPAATKNDGKLRIITDAPEIEIKAGVTSVNGQTGDVTIQTGGNYTAGNGIDITNDEIGLDGTYEGTFVDYSAMQGPAPSGFHVPLRTEWVALCGILTSTFGLANDNTTIETYLKMPRAGFRSDSNAGVNNVGSVGVYLSSTQCNTSKAYGLDFYGSNIYPEYYVRKGFGSSVRCFKNFPTVPTSSWTTLYDGSGVATGAGVFYSATDGLISVSGDGVNWYTIQDKNLGATTVYNMGDTLSNANCGYFYQWGNNYGFAHSGTLTTSSTKVDASNYGPGNYYSSSTFITKSPRDSTSNNNLWGGATGIVQKTASGNLIIGDKLYKIVTSTTAPASGVASNVITIVTD